MKLSPAKSIRGSVTVPGDKSISHRSVMLGSIARGTTEIHGFLEGADCLSTISCFRHMGVDIENKNGVVTVHGKGTYVAASNAQRLREEQQKQAEAELEQAIQKARRCGLTEEEIRQMVELILEG